MYDDDPADPNVRQRQTGPPLPPPAGFDSWRSWVRAGCPPFDDSPQEPKDYAPPVYSAEQSSSEKRRARRDSGQLGFEFPTDARPRRRHRAPR
jgi:hypothetical protein